MIRHARQLGFTLLEVILALGLTVVVMAAIGVAIHLHLRAVDKTRVGIERDQLARTLLRRIADDVRATIRREPFDDAGIQALTSSAEGAAKSIAEGAAGEESPSSGGGGIGRPGTTGTTGTTGSAGTAESLDSSSEDSAEDSEMAAGTPSPVPGLFGYQYELQVDVGRIPRPDEFTGAMIAGTPLPSDVKTVYYFIANSANGLSTSGATGLMRSEMNRASALWASETGDLDIFSRTAESLATEVLGIEFQYFDGYEWLPEWDSEVQKGLPLAIEIALVLADPDATEQTALAGSLFDGGLLGVDSELIYRTVVHLPNGQIPQSTSGSSGDSSASEEGSTDAGSSSKSGSSGKGGAQ